METMNRVFYCGVCWKMWGLETGKMWFEGEWLWLGFGGEKVDETTVFGGEFAVVIGDVGVGFWAAGVEG